MRAMGQAPWMLSTRTGLIARMKALRCASSPGTRASSGQATAAGISAASSSLETTARVHAADVILLQEIYARVGPDGSIVLPRALRATAKNLGMQYYARGGQDERKATRRRGRRNVRNCIVTLWRRDRFSLQGHGMLLASRTSSVTLLRLRDQNPITVINVHGEVSDEDARVGQFEAIAVHTATLCEVVVGGDFNSMVCSTWRSSGARLGPADCALRGFLPPVCQCSHAGCAESARRVATPRERRLPVFNAPDETYAKDFVRVPGDQRTDVIEAYTRRGHNKQTSKAVLDGFFTRGLGASEWRRTAVVWADREAVVWADREAGADAAKPRPGVAGRRISDHAMVVAERARRARRSLTSEGSQTREGHRRQVLGRG
jgi:endonuclease/exonuclease/phosphatase family metal-dependent hydrolase